MRTVLTYDDVKEHSERILAIILGPLFRHGYPSKNQNFITELSNFINGFYSQETKEYIVEPFIIKEWVDTIYMGVGVRDSGKWFDTKFWFCLNDEIKLVVPNFDPSRRKKG